MVSNVSRSPSKATVGKYYVAFYKGSSSHPVARFLDGAIRFVTRGPYSHVEIARKDTDYDFTIYSSSIRDGGVRQKTLNLKEKHWDLIPIENSDSASFKFNEASFLAFFNSVEGRKYDVLGVLGFVLYVRQSNKRYFCSEFVAEALKFVDPWRISPNDLYSLVQPIDK